MGGTLVTYQGFRCSDVVYRNSRGWSSDTTEVTFIVRSFPSGFEVVAAGVGELLQAPAPQTPNLEAIRAPRPRPRSTRGRVASGVGGGSAPPQPVRLEAAGTLTMAQVMEDGAERVVNAFLWVSRLELVRKSETGGPVKVRAFLVDLRHITPNRGFVTRWSFNRPRGDGALAADSVKPGGQAYSLREVAEGIARRLPQSPTLGAAPAEWAQRLGPVELSPCAGAWSALAEVVKLGGALEPCLRLDRALCLHKAGDGVLGYASEGAGPNAIPFPSNMLASLKGTGQGALAENSFAPDYVLVVGGERVTSRELDDCDPVLMLEVDVDDDAAEPFNVPAEYAGDTVVPLNEAVVRALTGGKLGLEGLRRFVVLPASYQAVLVPSRKVCHLLQEQAWRLWRLPKVVAVDGKPGENAHLLPLLDRADYGRSGRRLPVTVQIHRFGTQHRTMGDPGSTARDRLNLARSKKTEIRETIERKVAERAQGIGGNARGWLFEETENKTATSALLDALSETTLVPRAEIEAAIRAARLIERIKQLDPGLAAEYERAQQEEAAALDQANGTGRSELLAIGREALAIEEEARKAGAGFIDTAPERILTGRGLLLTDEERAAGEALKKKFQGKVEDIVKALREKEREAQRRRAAGVTTGDLKATTIGFVRNDPRRFTDRGARVVSAALGIVHTSRLPGWVKKEGVPAEDADEFLPKPVKVIFGTVAAPRTDQALVSAGTQGRDAPVPLSDGDGKSHFLAAFRRSAGSPHGDRIDPDAIPEGEGSVLARPEWTELVPLGGKPGNRAQLERDAEGLAAEQFARPVQVQERTVTLIGPWPVSPDGVVSSVEIRLRPKGAGFLTVVRTGGATAPDPNPMRTRVRPRGQQRPGRGRKREGLEP